MTLRAFDAVPFVFAALFAIGCGPEVDGDPPAETTTGATSSTTGTSSGGQTGVECDPTLSLCDGECVELRWSNDHCGQCGEVCEPRANTAGACADYECTPQTFCRLPGEGYDTCTEICESYGTECAKPNPDNGGWGSGHYGLFYDDEGAAICMGGGGSNSTVDADCDDPIDWDRTGGFNDRPVQGVICFCLQQ